MRVPYNSTEVCIKLHKFLFRTHTSIKPTISFTKLSKHKADQTVLVHKN